MTRIYLPEPLEVDARLRLPTAAAHHVAQVLRLKRGALLTLFNGAGGEYQAVVEAVERGGVWVRVESFGEIERESTLRVTLAQCVSKGERMDYAIQKAVELGVAAIVPLLSTRSVVRLSGERWEKKLEHWRGVIVAACEQCGRNRLPELMPVQTLDAWLDRAPVGVRLVLAPQAQGRGLGALPTPAAPLTLLVGPEGGLEPSELELAQRHGFLPLRLGPRVLRTETAGVAALAAFQALWGDLA
ncbi:MAG: 16S rRNA (uracil(1498)-N(3))-methyltransferase [Sinobacteraceae bacterium]|nr:16S rRNA (uracil(1498)-N(3))-methyltransferase [Nevskiaceae bacterium]